MASSSPPPAAPAPTYCGIGNVSKALDDLDAHEMRNDGSPQTFENPIETGREIRSSMHLIHPAGPSTTPPQQQQQTPPIPPTAPLLRSTTTTTTTTAPPLSLSSSQEAVAEHVHTAAQATHALADPSLAPAQRAILQLTRAIALAACGGTIPAALATAAIEAGKRVCGASGGEAQRRRLGGIVERVELVELCRIPFLMGVIARFFGEVCGIVVLAEAEEGGLIDKEGVEELVGKEVWRFNREVGDCVEEEVGTEAFERLCEEMGVCEESDDEDFEDGGDEGVGHVCGEECEGGGRRRGFGTYVAGAAVDDDQTDDGGRVSGVLLEDDPDEGDRGDDGSDDCSNPFEEDEQQDSERMTVFWTTIAAPGEDHHTFFERAMREVNERLTFIENVIGRTILSVAMKCDRAPATQFYTFYIPATRSILANLADEVTQEILKACERSGRRELAVPDATNFDPLRFHFLRRIFLGDHSRLASTMQGSTLDQEQRRNSMHVFWQNAVIDQRLSEEELVCFCRRLRDKKTFDEISGYIPTLQMDQSHTDFLNPTIDRIMIATRDLRPPAPTAGQSTLEVHGFQPKKASETIPGTGLPTMKATPRQRSMVAAEILNIFEKVGLNDQISTQKVTKDILGKMSLITFATFMDEANRPISGQAMKQSEKFIDGIYYAWTQGIISIRTLYSLKGHGPLQDFLTSCGEEMSEDALSLGEVPISVQLYLETRDGGAFGQTSADKTRKKSEKQGRPTKVEGLAEMLVRKPMGVSEKAKSASASPSTAQAQRWKSSTAKDIDLLDLLIGLILRALGSDVQEILKVRNEAMKRRSETGEGSSVTTRWEEEFSDKEVSRISNLMTTLAGYVRQYNGGQVNKGAMMAAHAEMKSILEKMLAGPNKADVVRALKRSDLLRLSNAKTPEEIVAYFISPVSQSSLGGVNAVSSPLPKVPVPKIPMPPEKQVQDATNEQERLLLEIRDMMREYHAAGLGFEQESSVGLATDRPLSFLEDFQTARSEQVAQKLRTGKLAKKQQTEDRVQSKEEVAAHKHHKSELTRRMLKITQNMLPYFSTKKFNAQDLSKHLMDSIETLPCDDLRSACTIIDQYMPKALKAGDKPSIVNLRACADEFDVMMEKMCSVVMPCKCKCKHDHGQLKG